MHVNVLNGQEINKLNSKHKHRALLSTSTFIKVVSHIPSQDSRLKTQETCLEIYYYSKNVFTIHTPKLLKNPKGRELETFLILHPLHGLEFYWQATIFFNLTF
jgi:hypothetical protein